MILDFFNPSNIINIIRNKINNISKNEILYSKFRFKEVKLINFEIPSPNFIAPLFPKICYRLYLLDLKLKYDFRLFFCEKHY